MAVALLAVLSHVPVLRGGFVWLDHGDLEAGAALRSPGEWFTHGFARTGFYRPLPAISLWFDSLFGGGPLPFHVHALLGHAAVAVSLGFAAEALGLTRRNALIAAAVFAVHPIGGVVGGLIALRPELMVTLALCWTIWAAKHDNARLAAGALLFGGLSKETALVLGPAFLLVLRAKPRVLWWAAGGWAVAVLLRLAFAPPWHATAAVVDLPTRLQALARGLFAMGVPFEIPLCDATAVTGLTVAGALALAIGVAIATRRPAGVLFALALLPAMNLVPLPRFWSLHYFYVPLAMLVMVIAHRALVPAVAVLATLSLYDARRFRSDETLWAADCREGALYLGDAYRARGELDRAAAAYERAVKPTAEIAFSDEAAAFQNLGLVRLAQRRFDEAEAAFEHSLQRTQDQRERRKLNHDLAAVAFARGDFDEVERRLGPEAARADALRESIELLQRSRAAAQLPAP